MYRSISFTCHLQRFIKQAFTFNCQCSWSLPTWHSWSRLSHSNFEVPGAQEARVKELAQLERGGRLIPEQLHIPIVNPEQEWLRQYSPAFTELKAHKKWTTAPTPFISGDTSLSMKTTRYSFSFSFGVNRITYYRSSSPGWFPSHSWLQGQRPKVCLYQGQLP